MSLLGATRFFLVTAVFVILLRFLRGGVLSSCAFSSSFLALITLSAALTKLSVPCCLFGGNYSFVCGETLADKAIVFTMVLLDPYVKRIVFAVVYGILRIYEARMSDMPLLSMSSNSFCFVCQSTA